MWNASGPARPRTTAPVGRPLRPGRSRSIPAATATRPRLDQPIGAVQPDAQALDAAGSEIDREGRADGEYAAARRGSTWRTSPAIGHDTSLGHVSRTILATSSARCVRTEEARDRGDQDQKRKQRHQRRQRDVARNRPAVIGAEPVKGVDRDAIEEADWVQARRSSLASAIHSRARSSAAVSRRKRF